MGDLDLVAAAEDPAAVVEAFAKLPGVARVEMRGPNRCRVALASGPSADLRVLPEKHWGSLLHHFTGNKYHNIRLREMAGLARERSLSTMVGLQARSDASVMYARDLIAEGYIGEVLAANLSIMTGAVLERGAGRSWQRVRSNGANTMTIAGGHGIDAMCAILGEFAEISARVTTRIKEWRDADTGQPLPVDGQHPAGQEAGVPGEKAGRVGRRRLDVAPVVADHERVAVQDAHLVSHGRTPCVPGRRTGAG